MIRWHKEKAKRCDCGRPIFGSLDICSICTSRLWRKEHPGYATKWRKNKPKQTHKPKHNKAPKISTCEIIKKHHDSMKDDPEHLTTEFIKKLIKVDCKDI